MNESEYMEQASRTEVARGPIKMDAAMLFYCAMFTTIAGELDIYKKHIFYGKELPEDMLRRVGRILDEMKILLNRGKPDQKNLDFEYDPRIFHGILGLATEVGELVEALGAGAQDGKIDEVNLKEELGDLQWYEAILMDQLGTAWTEVRVTNIKKLWARYPDKFTSHDALNRDLDKERTILEERGEEYDG